MRTGYRELRFGSVVSAGISFIIAVYAIYGFVSKISVWSSVATEEKVLWSLGLIGAVALIASSIFHTATETKWIGISHGVMMTLAAIVISSYSLHFLNDLKKHPRGGFVEMVMIPVCGGLILFAIVALGSALQTFLTLTKKKPNKMPEPTPGGVAHR